MKKIIFFIASLAIAFESKSGLFGPSTFEECLLDNVKNAKTNDAVAAVTSACSMKFQNKDQKNKPTSIQICKIYWDGWKFVQGDRPNAEYMTLEHSFLGAKALQLSLPRAMGKYLEVEKETKSDELDYKSKYGKFFSDNYSQIRSLCAFN